VRNCFITYTLPHSSHRLRLVLRLYTPIMIIRDANSSVFSVSIGRGRLGSGILYGTQQLREALHVPISGVEIWLSRIRSCGHFLRRSLF